MGNDVTGFLLGAGWWIVPLILVLFVVLAIASVRRKARRRRIQGELAAQRLLAETMLDLRDRTPESQAGTAAGSGPDED